MNQVLVDWSVLQRWAALPLNQSGCRAGRGTGAIISSGTEAEARTGPSNVIEKQTRSFVDTGGALNMCLEKNGKPIGVLYLRQRDFPVVVVRGLTEAAGSTPRHW